MAEYKTSSRGKLSVRIMDIDFPTSSEDPPLYEIDDEEDEHDDEHFETISPLNRLDDSGHRRSGRRTQGNSRSADARNKAESFLGYHNMSLGSIDSDDRSMISGQSGVSQRTTETTSSIITALLGSVRIHNPAPLSAETTEIMVVSDVRLAGLVRVLMSSAREDGIPCEYASGNSLARRMKEVFTFPLDKAPGWLWKPLFDGLMNGGESLDVMVVPPAASSGAQPMPILAWLCQWRSLQKVFSWKGGNDLVSMVLAAGANPNIAMRNGSTPLFFAVKYGSLETVELLVKYGADLTIKDNKKRSCLWNAIERPDPEIIAYLLTTLPATETFPYQGKNLRTTYFQTAVDYLFAAQLSLSLDPATSAEYPWSWQVLGEPSEEDVALTMIEFGKRGATFTPGDITLALLGFVLRGDDSRRRRNRYPKYEEARLRLERLAQLVVGRWLPDSVRSKLQPFGEALDGSDRVFGTACRMCNTETTTEPERPQIKLYCGHSFCVACVVGRSEEDNADLSCPACRKVLCLDVTGSVSKRSESLAEVYCGYSAPYGPVALSSKQLRMECQKRGIQTLLRNDDRLRKMLLNESVQSSANRQRKPVPHFDLNTNVPINNGTDEHLEAPKAGPVVIPIIVKGVPVTAFLSTTSYFTLLSPEFVEHFGLRKVGLETNSLTNVFGSEPCKGRFSLVEEFRFELGGIDVCLRNALEASLPSCFGVQLGLDFFRSGAWCVIDVKLDDTVDQATRLGSSITTDGFGQSFFINSNRKEELRYHTHDGRSSRLPLMHLQPFKVGSMSNWVSVALGESLAECSWCCRIFSPHAMLSCPQCPSVYYCTTECRDSASLVHNAKAHPIS